PPTILQLLPRPTPAFFFSMLPRPPTSTLFPYTTLFRSTSDPHTFAIGECALYNDMIYGLVAPGYEMAEVAATTISGEQKFFSGRSEEHTSELQSRENLVCRLLLEKKKQTQTEHETIRIC